MASEEVPMSIRQKESGEDKLRKSIDIATPMISTLENRIFSRRPRDRPTLQPHSAFTREMVVPAFDRCSTSECITTRLQFTGLSKSRDQLNAIVFGRDFQRIITGGQTGEITSWSGQNFEFEMLYQAHDTSVLRLAWNRVGNLMASGDASGSIRYSDASFKVHHSFQAHEASVNDVTFAPSDLKLVTCGDEPVVKVWDFLSTSVECELKGHGSAVSTCQWHPTSSLIATGSKDTSIKLWDVNAPPTAPVATFAQHTGVVRRVAWNANGNWLLSASGDQTARLFDIRMNRDISVFASQHRGCTAIAWHPFNEKLFTLGNFDGCLQFFDTDHNTFAIADVPHAHDGSITDLAWSQAGHVLATCSRDTTAKFWARSRPGDTAKQYAFQGNPNKNYPENNNENIMHVSTAVLAPEDGVTASSSLSSSAALIASLGLLASSTATSFAYGSTGAGGADMLGSFEEADMDARKTLKTKNRAVAYQGSLSEFISPAGGQPGGPRPAAPSHAGPRGPSSTAGRVPQGDYICKKCGQPGHFIQDCPNVPTRPRDESGRSKPAEGYTCMYCGVKADHWHQDCPARGPTGRLLPAPPNLVCSSCGVVGDHWPKECPSTRKPRAGYICHGCGSTEHFKDDCPRLKGKTGPPGAPSSSAQPALIRERPGAAPGGALAHDPRAAGGAPGGGYGGMSYPPPHAGGGYDQAYGSYGPPPTAAAGGGGYPPSGGYGGPPHSYAPPSGAYPPASSYPPAPGGPPAHAPHHPYADPYASYGMPPYGAAGGGYPPADGHGYPPPHHDAHYGQHPHAPPYAPPHAQPPHGSGAYRDDYRRDGAGYDDYNRRPDPRHDDYGRPPMHKRPRTDRDAYRR